MNHTILFVGAPRTFFSNDAIGQQGLRPNRPRRYRSRDCFLSVGIVLKLRNSCSITKGDVQARDGAHKPALFTRVLDETAETASETGARSREGGRHKRARKVLRRRRSTVHPPSSRRRIAARDGRDWRDGGGFEVRSSRFSELRTPNFELQAAPVALDVPVTRLRGWRTFSAPC